MYHISSPKTIHHELGITVRIFFKNDFHMIHVYFYYHFRRKKMKMVDFLNEFASSFDLYFKNRKNVKGNFGNKISSENKKMKRSY